MATTEPAEWNSPAAMGNVPRHVGRDVGESPGLVDSVDDGSAGAGLTDAYNVALAKVVPATPDSQEFLWQLLSDDELQKLLIGISGRPAQNGFNKSDISAVCVAIPTDGILLERFEQYAVQIRNLVLTLRERIQFLRRRRDLLLQRLLSGQLEMEAA